MTEREQIEHLDEEIKKVLRRFVSEYQISNASAIGVLQLNIYDICRAGTEEVESEP